MKKRRSNKINKLVTWVIIPLALILLWLVASVIYSSTYNGSYTVITHNHSKDSFTNIPNKKLLKGEKITGEFVAQDDNLGILAIRFKQGRRIPWEKEDILQFRIKEKGATEWYYENEYYSGLTFDVPFLPVGFPVIQDSKGKTYYFEFESLRGNAQNGLVLDTKRPVLASRYQVDRHELIDRPDKLLNFLVFKTINSLDTPDILYSSLIYLLPFWLYVLWITKALDPLLSPLLKRYQKSALKKTITKIYQHEATLTVIFSSLLLIAVLIDILRLQVLNDMLYLVVILLWVIIQRLAGATTVVTFVVGLLLLAIAPISLEFDNITIAEKAAAWAFMFLAGGVFMEMILLRKSGK